MNINNIFQAFSRRHPSENNRNPPLTPEFRNRVIVLWRRTFAEESFSGPTLWSEVHEKLLYSLGRQRLSAKSATTWKHDLFNFIGECSDDYFLEFIELSFQTNSVFYAKDSMSYEQISSGQVIDNINAFLEVDNIPYYLTKFAHRNGRIEAFPQIIRRDSDVLHDTAIQPALALLRYSGFETANQEFLEALNHYRVGEYGDSVLKCQNSFESVMKIICEQKEWTYKRHDTLLTELVEKSNLPPFFKHPLALIGTIRTELGKSHGAGTESREISPHVAQYAINATASAILLLMGETNP